MTNSLDNGHKYEQNFISTKEKSVSVSFIQLKKKLKFAEDDTTTTTVKKDFYSRRGILQLFLNFYCVAAEQERQLQSRRAAPNNKSRRPKEKNFNETRTCVRVQSVESDRERALDLSMRDVRSNVVELS